MSKEQKTENEKTKIIFMICNMLIHSEFKKQEIYPRDFRI